MKQPNFDDMYILCNMKLIIDFYIIKNTNRKNRVNGVVIIPLTHMIQTGYMILLIYSIPFLLIVVPPLPRDTWTNPKTSSSSKIPFTSYSEI